MEALGMVELNSVAAGVKAGDEMLKTANVELIAAQPTCPGKYMIVVQGKVSAAGMNMIAKDESQMGKAMVLSAMVETYAVLGFLVSALLIFSYNFPS